MANTRDSAITADEIEAYKRRINPKTGKKYTQNDIAAEIGVSRQRISQIVLSNPRRSETPRRIALKNYPWKTGERFHNASPNRRMRDHAEYMATGGKGMDVAKLQRLRWFYDKLESENVVVEFDPSIPPIEGVSSDGGFAFRPRKDSDGDLIIRVNEYTTLTETGKMIWRFPPRKPKVR